MIDLRKRTLENPDRPVYIMATSGEVVTAIQLEDRANRCSHLLRDLGLQIGDHIAIFMENNRHFLEICGAAGRSGLIYTPISTYLTADEISYILNNSGAKALFCSKAMLDAVPLTRDLMPKVAGGFSVDGAVGDFESYEDSVAGYPKTPIDDQMAGRDMLYSSGTTGMPKAVKLTYEPLPYGEIPEAGKSLISLYGFDENTVYLSPAPLYHAAPLRFTQMALYAGGTAIIMERFDALRSLALIEQYRVTHSQWVPTMFIRMLKLPEEQRLSFDVSSQKIAIHAAAPIPIPVKEQMIEWWGPVLFEYYAGTEGNGLTAITSEEWLSHKGSVGRSFVGTAHILDERGNELPPGEPGLIFFAGGEEFEYLGDPEKTEASRSPQGWSTMNDIGHLDDEGYLYLTDRATNMIISGGVNIYPQEAENVLVMHPRVMDAAVIGVPNEDFGEEVKGVVQPRDMADAGSELEQELIAFCRSKLSRIKCPASIDFEAELPRTASGKLLKRLLRDRYWGTG
jgi:acyl-CoA synthetase (AMP-forming)/AMP-acid ligase II